MSNRREPTIGEYVTPASETLRFDARLCDAAARMRANHARKLVVVGEAGVVGVLDARDVACAELTRRIRSCPQVVAEAMTPRPLVVDSSTPLREVANELLSESYCATVIVDGGVVRGLFTARDEARALLDALDRCVAATG